ncbi:CPBP family intramembrane glutamic endopeptidase [Streptococcus danieliae]|uniref:CPBP family intramembrane glutamic endopeptidase n=1 Tax=Streptococcus danieliae TaxID=747656 RepID=UPI0021C6E22C|nr:CPBP family intramembrane glutamic endopeptidase [Streptococcus danieliae]MCU0082693.1 CPBP family intramembrane metalloprotease [Streptococcus danieliae]
MNKRFSQIDSIVLSLAMIVIAAVFSGLGFSIYFLIHYSIVLATIMKILLILIGFIILPYLLIRFLDIKIEYSKLSRKTTFILFILITCLSLYFLHSGEVIHSFFIALGEEILFRMYILSILLQSFSKKQSIFLGSLLFAFVLHLNGNLFVNAIVKLPASFILYYIADRFGIQASIGFHWSHNLLVGYLFG